VRQKTVLLTLLLSTGVAISQLTGCSSPDPIPASPGAGAAGAPIDGAIQARIARAVRVAAACGKHGGAALDSSCVAQELSRPAPSPAVEALAKKASQLSHAQICGIAHSVAGGHHAYYVQGVMTGAAADSAFPAGVERVWDLSGAEAASFIYAAEGTGSILPADTDAYAGFATGSDVGHVTAAWNGRRIARGGDFTSVLSREETSGFSLNDATGTFQGVVGAMASRESLARFGLELAPRLVVDAPPAAGYRSHDALTRTMTSYAPGEQLVVAPEGAFLSFPGDALLDGATALAVNILTLSDGQPGSFPAAAAAIVLDAARAPAFEAACAGAGQSFVQSAGALGARGGAFDDGTLGELDIFAAPTDASPVDPTGTSDCALVEGQCDALFPGKGYVCGANGDQGSCCRKAFVGKKTCYGDDCGPGELCAQSTNDLSRGDVFACINPADPDVACIGTTRHAPLPRLDSEILLAAFIPCGGLGARLLGCFTGDNRSFDYDLAMSQSRLAVKVTIDTEGRTAVQRYVGSTHSINCGDLDGAINCSTITSSDSITECGTAPISSVAGSGARAGDRNKVSIVFRGANPCVPGAPAIDGRMTVFVDYTIQEGVRVPLSYTWVGLHEYFPAWELYINGSRKHEYDPVAEGYGPDALNSGFPRLAGVKQVSGHDGH
jgi:hypothetical protein